MQRTLGAVLFGNNNKKRKRNEVEGFEGNDEGHRRKRLMDERMKQLNEQGADVNEIIMAAAQFESEQEMVNATKQREKLVREL